MPSDVLRRLAFVVDVDDHATKKLAQIDMMGDRVATNYSAAAAQLQLFKSALTATGVVALGASAAIAAVTWQGAQLDRSLATIEATASATTEEMGLLREEITQIGIDTPATILDVAGAFKELSYAGFETQEILASGMDVVELAIAGNIRMGEAAKITAQNLRAFGLEAEQASAVSNTLASVFASSATEIEQLANGLSYVNATASQLGFSITEITAALGVLADNAIEGTRAGTSLNQAFAKLFAQTGKVRQALDAIGLSIRDFTDEKGDAKELTEMLTIMRDRMEELNMTRSGMVAWTTDVFGRRGARAMIPLIQNLDKLEEKQADVGFAQLKSEVRALSELEGEQALINLEEMLFRDSDNERDILNETPEPNRILRLLQDRYGQGAIAASQITSALKDAFPAMEQFAAEQVAEQLTAQEVSLQELASAYDITTREAGKLAASLTEQEQALAVARLTMQEATTDAEIYQAFLDRVGGKLSLLKGDISALADMLFVGLAPELSNVLDLLLGWADTLQQNEKLVEDLGKGLFYLAAGATAATAALAGLAGVALFSKLPVITGFLLRTAAAGSVLGPVFQGLISTVTWLSGGLTTLAALAKGAAASVGVLASQGFPAGQALASLFYGALKVIGILSAMNPVVLALVGVAAIAGAAIAAWATDFHDFREKAQPAAKAVASITDGIVEFGGAVINWGVWALRNFTEWLSKSGAAKGFVNVLARTVNWLGYFANFLARVLHYAGRVLNILGEAGWNIFSGKLGRMNDVLKETVDLFNKLTGADIGNDAEFSAARDDQNETLAETGDGVLTMGMGGKDPEARGQRAGEATMEGMAKGISQKQSKPRQATARSMRMVDAHLPSSDAQRGALSNLTESGRKTMSTFAKGIRSGRHTATSAVAGGMQRIRERLGPGGLGDVSDETFDRLDDAVADAQPAVETLDEAVETLNDTINILFDWLRSLSAFRLDLTTILGPLGDLWGSVDDNILGLNTLTNWLAGLELFELNLDTSITPLGALHSAIDDATSRAQDLYDALADLASLDVNVPFGGAGTDDDGTDDGDGTDTGGGTGSGDGFARGAPTSPTSGGAGGAGLSGAAMSLAFARHAVTQPGRGASQPTPQGQGPTGTAAPNPADRALRAMRAEQLAGQRAASRAQPLLPKAFNAVRSDLIPSFVPTMSGSGGGGGGGGLDTDDGSDTGDDTDDGSETDDGTDTDDGSETDDGTDTGTDDGSDTGAMTMSASSGGAPMQLEYSPDVSVAPQESPDATASAVGDELARANESLVEDLARLLRRDAASGGGG